MKQKPSQLYFFLSWSWSRFLKAVLKTFLPFPTMSRLGARGAPHQWAMVHSLLEVLSALTVRDCRGFCGHAHRCSLPPNYSKTSRFPTHSVIGLVGQSSLATPTLSLSAPGFSGSPPRRDPLRRLRMLLPVVSLCVAAGCAVCCCWLLRKTGRRMRPS